MRTPDAVDLPRWRRAPTVVGVVLGLTSATGVAFAASNWVVGVASGSSAAAQAATVSNLTVAAITPVTGIGNQLYPGATGDAQLKVTNPNAFPVTITAIAIPATQATGYTDSGLTTPATGCDGTSSTVTWVGTAGSHGLTTSLTVGANASLTVTLTNEVTMGSTSPAACAGAYFKLPSLTGVTATGGAAAATSSPASDTYS